MSAASIKDFLKRKNVSITVQTYLIDALGAMAFGLFASLLIGTIFGTLGQQFHIEIFNVIADYAKRLREYKATSALYKNASFFNEELDKTYLPTELYTLYTEYVNFYNDTKIELRKINEDYIELKKLVDTGCLDGKKLYQAISKLAGPYIDNLSDNIFLKIELAYWENQEQEEKAKEFRDNDSHIRNTRVVLSRLLNNSDKLICKPLAILCKLVMEILRFPASTDAK